MKTWTIRVCRECGGHHGRLHDGCVTYSNPMFPQMTERAGVDEVRVVALDDVVRFLDNESRDPVSAREVERAFGGAIAPKEEQ